MLRALVVAMSLILMAGVGPVVTAQTEATENSPLSAVEPLAGTVSDELAGPLVRDFIHEASGTPMSLNKLTRLSKGSSAEVYAVDSRVASCVLHDDADLGQDASNTENGASLVGPGSHDGCVGGADTADWYQFHTAKGDIWNVTLKTHGAADLDLRWTSCHGSKYYYGGNPPPEDEFFQVASQARSSSTDDLCLEVIPFAGISTYTLILEPLEGPCWQDDAGTGRDASPNQPIEVGLGSFTVCTKGVSGSMRHSDPLDLSGRTTHHWFSFTDWDYFHLNLTPDVGYRVTATQAQCRTMTVYPSIEGTWQTPACGDPGTWHVYPNRELYPIKFYGTAGLSTITIEDVTPTCPAPQNDFATGHDSPRLTNASQVTMLALGTHAGCVDRADVADFLRFDGSGSDIFDATLNVSSGRVAFSAYAYDGDTYTKYLGGTGSLDAGESAPLRVAGLGDTGQVIIAAVGLDDDARYEVTWSRQELNLPSPSLLLDGLNDSSLAACHGDLYAYEEDAFYRLDGNDWTREWLFQVPRGSSAPWLVCSADGLLVESPFYESSARPRMTHQWSIDNRHLIPWMRDAIGPAATGPDGRFYAPDGMSIHVTDCATKQSSSLEVGASSTIWDIAFAPDGDLWFNAGGNIYEMQDGEPILRSVDGTRYWSKLAFTDDGDVLARDFFGFLNQLDGNTGTVTQVAFVANAGGIETAHGDTLLFRSASKVYGLDLGISLAQPLAAPACGQSKDWALTDLQFVPFDVESEVMDDLGLSSYQQDVEVTVTNLGGPADAQDFAYLDLYYREDACNTYDAPDDRSCWLALSGNRPLVEGPFEPGEAKTYTVEVAWPTMTTGGRILVVLTPYITNLYDQEYTNDRMVAYYSLDDWGVAT